MKTIQWTEFSRQNPIRLFKRLGVDRLKVTYKKGAYFNVYYHPAWEKNMGFEKGDGFVTKAKKKFYNCSICDSITKVRYIIPYDGSRPPGHYCYACRRKLSLMDVKDAQRYNKVL